MKVERFGRGTVWELAESLSRDVRRLLGIGCLNFVREGSFVLFLLMRREGFERFKVK